MRSALGSSSTATSSRGRYHRGSGKNASNSAHGRRLSASSVPSWEIRTRREERRTSIRWNGSRGWPNSGSSSSHQSKPSKSRITWSARSWGRNPSPARSPTRTRTAAPSAVWTANGTDGSSSGGPSPKPTGRYSGGGPSGAGSSVHAQVGHRHGVRRHDPHRLHDQHRPVGARDQVGAEPHREPLAASAGPAARAAAASSPRTARRAWAHCPPSGPDCQWPPYTRDMSARGTRLLLLGGVAMFQPVNGYQIRRELVSWQVDRWANIKPGSIYHGLGRLAEEGLLRRTDLVDAGREVAVYEVTDAGREQLRRDDDRGARDRRPVRPHRLPHRVRHGAAGPARAGAGVPAPATGRARARGRGVRAGQGRRPQRAAPRPARLGAVDGPRRRRARAGCAR